MALTHSILVLVGIAMCAVAMMQLGLWAASSVSMLLQNRRQFELSRQLMLQQIDHVIEQRVALAESDGKTLSVDHAVVPNSPLQRGRWSGFRSFVVKRVDIETPWAASVYLMPEDGKSIPNFLPGQHLTIRIPVPGQAKPVVRCYSISNGFHQNDADREFEDPYYRISVKLHQGIVAATEHAPQRQIQGIASTFINQSLRAGDRLEVKAPAGKFWLDENDQSPVVMLAGGIGITPMISMLERLSSLVKRQNNASQRSVILFYGIRNSAEHVFEAKLKSLATRLTNLHVITCYSRPLETDTTERDFQVNGRVSIDLIRKVLPSNDYQFYLCGPASFMTSLYEGLLAWEVPEDRIHYEAFGPASIGKKKQTPPSNAGNSEDFNLQPVKFANAGKTVLWDEQFDSLLELAEASGVHADSGCRAGSCGSCETGVLSGQVHYADGQEPECGPSRCLLCIAKPNSALELDL